MLKFSSLKILLIGLIASSTLGLASCQKPDDEKTPPSAKTDLTPKSTAQERIQIIPGARPPNVKIVILSIYPVFIDWYEQGKKSFEYRKKFPTDPISHIVYYNNGTKQLMAVTGVQETLVGTPEDVVQLTWPQSGAPQSQLLEYYQNSKEAYAIKARTFWRLPMPLDLAQLSKLGFFPSSRFQLSADFPELDVILKKQIETLENQKP